MKVVVFFLSLLVCGSAYGQIDLVVGPQSTSVGWAVPSVSTLPGERYNLSIDWGDQDAYYMNYQSWTPVAELMTHQYYGLMRYYNVTMKVKKWHVDGTPYPDQVVYKLLKLPPPLNVLLTPGHGTLDLDINGGVGPYRVMLYGPMGMKNLVVNGSFGLYTLPGYYYVIVQGTNTVPGYPNRVLSSDDAAGGTTMVLP
jgi:hypothetical protein